MLQLTEELDSPVFQNAAADAVEDYREGQAFQHISFKGEHAVVNRQWVERCTYNLPIMDVPC